MDSKDSQNRALIAADRARVNLQWFSLLRGAVRLKAVELDKPQIYVQINQAGSPHWIESVPEATDATEETGQSEPWAVIIDALVVNNGRLDYSEPNHPEAYQSLVEAISFQLEGLDTRLSAPGPIALTLSTEKSGTIAVTGQLAFNPFRIDGQLNITNLDLEPGWRYARYVHQLILNQGTELDGSSRFPLTGGTETASGRSQSIRRSLAEIDQTLISRIYLPNPRVDDLSGGDRVVLKLTLETQ